MKSAAFFLTLWSLESVINANCCHLFIYLFIFDTSSFSVDHLYFFFIYMGCYLSSYMYKHTNTPVIKIYFYQFFLYVNKVSENKLQNIKIWGLYRMESEEAVSLFDKKERCWQGENYDGGCKMKIYISRRIIKIWSCDLKSYCKSTVIIFVYDMHS